MLWVLLWVGLGLFVLFYVFAPLLVLISQSANLQPRADVLAPGQALPHFGPELSKYGSSLRSLGFTMVGTMLLPDLMPNSTGLVRLYVNRTTGQQAAALGLITTSQSHLYLEYMTIQADGTTVCTGNSNQVNAFKPDPMKHMLQAPDRVDASTLYRLHQYRESQLLDSRQPRYLPPPGEEVQQALMGVVRDFLRQCRLGRFRRVGTRAKPTLAGAYVMTWMQLPPFKQVLLGRARSRVAREWAAAENALQRQVPVRVTHELPKGFAELPLA